MMESGKRTKQMDKASLLTLITQCMKDNGKMINSMVMEGKHGVNQEVKMLHILEYFTRERRMEKEGFSGKTAHIMKEIS